MVRELHSMQTSKITFATLTILVLLAFGSTTKAAGQPGIITTVAGNGTQGYNGSTVATSAELNQPSGVALDGAGNLYIADTGNCVVWKLAVGSNTLSVFAGQPGQCTPESTATEATSLTLYNPADVAVCGNSVYVATHLKSVTSATFPYPVTYSPAAVYQIDSTTSAVKSLQMPGYTLRTTGGGPVYPDPNAVTCEASGSVYLESLLGYGIDYPRDSIDVIPASGTPYNLYMAFDTFFYGVALQQTGTDLDAYTVGLAGDAVQISPNGAANNITLASPLKHASHLAVDSNGIFYVSEDTPSPTAPSNYIQTFSISTKAVTTIAGTGTAGYNGDGILASKAELNNPGGMAIGASGDIYIADTGNNRIRRIHFPVPGPSGLVATGPLPQSSTFGYQQGALNPSTGMFYYSVNSNTVNVLTTTNQYLCTSYECIVAEVQIGASHSGGSQITLMVDSARNLIYANNAYDGNLYEIDGNPESTTFSTVVASIPLNNPSAALLAFDSVDNLLYVAGPNAQDVSVVQGGAAMHSLQSQPLALLGNVGYPASFVASLAADSTTHNVYAVSNTGAGNGQESFITLSFNGAGTLPTASSQYVPTTQDVLYPNFLANSLSVDPLTGSVLLAGIASPDPGQTTYDASDIYQFQPGLVYAQAQFNYPPTTTVNDSLDSAFYVTDYEPGATSSHAALVTGVGSQVNNGGIIGTVLTPIEIPVFGSDTAPASPQVYDLEPDMLSY